MGHFLYISPTGGPEGPRQLIAECDEVVDGLNTAIVAGAACGKLILVGFEVAKTFALLLEIPEILIEPVAALGQIGIVNISGNP